jgi:hypothetical protein
METIDTLAITRDAYQAYGDCRDWKAYDGKPMPTFDALPDGIRDAWHASTRKVIDSYQRASTVTQPDHVSPLEVDDKPTDRPPPEPPGHGGEPPPGHGGENPGHGGEPPGHGGENPGHGPPSDRPEPPPHPAHLPAEPPHATPK